MRFRRFHSPRLIPVTTTKHTPAPTLVPFAGGRCLPTHLDLSIGVGSFVLDYTTADLTPRCAADGRCHLPNFIGTYYQTGIGIGR